MEPVFEFEIVFDNGEFRFRKGRKLDLASEMFLILDRHRVLGVGR